MGDLIVMSRSKPLPPREAIASAEILFFTGVRYYRMNDDAGAKPSFPPVVAKAIGKRRRPAVPRRRASASAATGPIEALV